MTFLTFINFWNIREPHQSYFLKHLNGHLYEHNIFVEIVYTYIYKILMENFDIKDNPNFLTSSFKKNLQNTCKNTNKQRRFLLISKTLFILNLIIIILIRFKPKIYCDQ